MDERETEAIEDELATLAASINSAMARFLELLGELDRREAWAGKGFMSLAHWLAFRCGMDLRTAREHVRVAKAARDLPRTLDAMRHGELSYSKARAVTRSAKPETEEKILDVARNATAAQLEKVLAVWRKADPAGERELAENVEESRRADFFFDEDGSLVINAKLSADEGALFMRAIESARDALWKEKRGGFGPAERADALVQVADRSLSEGAASRSGGDRTMVMVHVDSAVLQDPGQDGQARIEGGPQCSADPQNTGVAWCDG